MTDEMDSLFFTSIAQNASPTCTQIIRTTCILQAFIEKFGDCRPRLANK